ncbi:MAG: DUF4372 domain-containing protein [Balneolaceae bacterium]|nr:MAG: DUF4372 domain-containing protein [Balneolaceae bacterium]
MDVVPKYKFQKIVKRHKGNHRVRKLTCREQFICMCFGQLTFRDSLRDVTTTLNALDGKRYHMGLSHKVPLSTLSDANSTQPWQRASKRGIYCVVNVLTLILSIFRNMIALTKPCEFYD